VSRKISFSLKLDVGSNQSRKPRVGAVNFLNSVPLVWGMLHGPESSLVDLSFSVPSECAEQVEAGQIDIGLLPVAEIARQGLEILPGLGIAALGPVRSILLFSKVPWDQIRTLHADSSSRTSVELARVILRERFGVEPEISRHAPALGVMMDCADSALIIGDPALLIDPMNQPYAWLDLGDEWHRLTNLPFVFAAWAGKAGIDIEGLAQITENSWRFGKERIDDIIESEYERRGVTKQTAREYLTRHIRFELGSAEYRGLDQFLALAGLPEIGIGLEA
jgi:chorismate dehydratase